MHVVQLVARLVVFVLAAVVVGPAAMVVWSWLPTVDGGPGATLLVTGSTVSSLARLGIVVVAVGATGCLAARLVSARWGLWCAGVVLAWIASRATTSHMLQATNNDAVIRVLVAESLIAIMLGVLLTGAVVRCSSGSQRAAGRPKAGWDEVVPSVLGCAGVAAAVVWVVAREALPAQVLWATGLGSLAGAVVAGVVSQRVSIVLVISTVPALGLAALLTRLAMGSSGLVEQASAGELWPVLLPTPMQWLAGALLGVPVGLSWSGSLVVPYVSGENSQENTSDSPAQV